MADEKKADDKSTTLAEADIPYQQRPAVAQLRGELANALAYGQTDRVASVRKQLAFLGVAEEATSEKAAEKRQAAAADNPAAKVEPPVERVAPRDKHVATAPSKPTGRA